MKRIVSIIIVLALMGGTKLLAGVPAPENGFWVIITNENGPAQTTVKYYDLGQHLVYEEHLDGVRLDGKSRRVTRMLNKKLQRVLIAWVRNK